MEKYERRDFPVELRVNRAEGKPTKITGHAAVFDKLSVNLHGYQEKIESGAFADSIKSDDVRALFNHDPNLVLGRSTAGTLMLKEDSKGLYYEIQPPDTQAARDLITLIERGDISQNSFGFRVLPDGSTWDEDKEGNIIRTLMKVKLFDISPVTFPAYPQTDIALRSNEEILAEGRNLLKKPIGRTLKAFDRERILQDRLLENNS